MQTQTVQQSMPTALIGFFNDEESMTAAYEILTDLEYPAVAITLAMAEKTYNEKYLATPENATAPKTDAQGGPDVGLENDDSMKTTKAAEGFALGTTTGASIGAIALLGASLIFPGIVVLGPLAATLAGAGAGATVGGLTGLLFGSGHPEAEQHNYEDLIQNGKFMIRVSPKSIEDANVIERNWKVLGGEIEVHY